MASKSKMPPNIQDDGRTAGGMLRIRNAIETGTFVGLLFLFEKTILFPLPALVKYGITILIGLPVAIISLVGIGDLSLTEWYIDRKSFRKSQAVYPFKIPTKEQEKKKGLFFKKNKEKKWGT